MIATDFQEVAVAYAIFHRPTNKWVMFKQDEEYSHLYDIVLVDEFEKADKFPFQSLAKVRLQSSCMFDEKSYGKANFLEFDILKFNIEYRLAEQ